MFGFRRPRLYLARELKIGILASLALVALGTLGFKLAGGPEWSLLDAVYMTVITISTVGFEEVHPLDTGGRIVALLVMFCGVGLVFYIAGSAAEAVIAGQIFRRDRMERAIASIDEHFIICGYGRMGKSIASELTAQSVPFVIIEKMTDGMPDPAMPCVIGDATDDETLERAGIGRARGLVSVLATDAENIYAVLAARSLRPDLTIIARCSETRSRKKLLAAGADRVINPYERGGSLLAHVMMRPLVVDFFERMVIRGDEGVLLEEIPVRAGSPLIGVPLSESPIRRDLDIIVLQIVRASGEQIFNPSSSDKIEAGDVLVATGRASALDRLTQMAGAHGRARQESAAD